MQDSFRSYMRVGIIHFMAYPATMKGEGPIVETVKKIAHDDYFDVIEITWIKDPAVRKEVKGILETAHMTVAYGGQPRLLTTGLNINDLDDGKRRQAIATLKEGIDEAYEMGAVGFAFLSGPYQENRKEAAFDALAGFDQGALRVRQVQGQHEGRPGGLRLRHRQEEPDRSGRSGQTLRGDHPQGVPELRPHA